MTSYVFTSSDRPDKYVRSGMSEAEAVRHARLEFGRVDRGQDECREAGRVTFVEPGPRLDQQQSRTLPADTYPDCTR